MVLIHNSRRGLWNCSQSMSRNAQRLGMSTTLFGNIHPQPQPRGSHEGGGNSQNITSKIGTQFRSLRTSTQLQSARDRTSSEKVEDTMSDSEPEQPDDKQANRAYIIEKATLTSASAVVHVHYDIDNPPPKPPVPSLESSPSPTSGVSAEVPAPTLKGHWTRFVCLSDTHSRVFPVPDGDVLLHSGDLTATGLVEEFEETVKWLCGMKHKKKIIIGGNHDLTLHLDFYEREWARFHRGEGKQDVKAIRELLCGPAAAAADLVYLQDEEHKFQVREGGKTWSVYGSPWSPEFYNWAFNYPRKNGAALVSKFPKVDILLTHGPPFGIFDMTRTEDEVGCEDLRHRLPELRPRLHVSGHIHEARGAHIHTWDQPPNLDEVSATDSNEDLTWDALPLVQYEALFSKKLTEKEVGIAKNSWEGLGDSLVSEEELKRERTVFVNAANWPAGKRARNQGARVPFGGEGFRPIIVDLWEGEESSSGSGQRPSVINTVKTASL